MEENGKEKTRRRTAFIISIIVFVIVIALCLLYLKMCTPLFGVRGGALQTQDTDSAAVQSETYADSAEATESETEPLPENPVNFSKQMEINDEIYAWIYIPGTNVNYPILQSREDDLYYMRRNVDKSYYIPGVIFTQSHNKKDFSDPVTVIYGHNMTEDGSMFATLHNFEDTDFFNANEDVFIYTPGHILKYRVVSAFKYDSRHIMNSFNFDDEAAVSEFFDYVLHPTMIPQNVRIGAELTTDDRLVVLSTCMANNTYRYLVCASLVSDEITK